MLHYQRTIYVPAGRSHLSVRRTLQARWTLRAQVELQVPGDGGISIITGLFRCLR